MDYCKHCTARGDFDKCLDSPCTYRDSWYSETIITACRNLKDYLESKECMIVGFDIPDNIYDPFRKIAVSDEQ